MTNNSFIPKVSIVIPVFNGSNYLSEAIESALRQTYKNIEVLVINDGSTDNGATEQIAMSFGNRIRYFCKENGGVATALNYGILNMEGDYFSWLSHDDLYSPTKVEKQIEALSRCDDKTAIVACGHQVIDPSGNVIYDINPLKKYSKEQLEARPLFALLRGCIHGCSLLIHASHFDRAGVFNPNLPTTQDYDLWFRIMRGNTINFAEGLLVKSRCHEDQGSKIFLESHIEESSKLWIGMISNLTKEEMIQIDGSVYMFYNNTRSYLREFTLYNDVIEKLDQLVLLAAKNEFVENRFEDWFRNELGAQISNTEFAKVGKVINIVKKRPRIVMLLPLPSALGGLNKVVLQIASQLCDYYEVFLLSVFEDDGTGYPLDARIVSLVLPTINSDRNYLARVLSSINIDICIVSHNCDKQWLEVYGALHSYGIKSIAWNHEFYFLPYWNIDLINCLESKNAALSKADVVLWLNSFSANAYALLHDNAAIMHNPVTITPPEVLPITRPQNIVAISRFDDPRKGLNELLLAFAEVAKRCKEASLYVLGSYDLNQRVPSADSDFTYRQLVDKLHLPKNRLHFIGWNENIGEYLRSARVHILPSKYEGFGLVITEASSFGVPSIIFNGSGLDDIIHDGVDGYIVPAGDIKTMARATIELLENDELFTRMSNAAINIAERFKMETIVSKWRDLIEAVLSKTTAELLPYLASNYMFPVKNTNAFLRQFAKEYEMSVIKLAITRTYTSHSRQSWFLYKRDLIKYLIKATILSLKRNGIIGTIRKIKRWALARIR